MAEPAQRTPAPIRGISRGSARPQPGTARHRERRPHRLEQGRPQARLSRQPVLHAGQVPGAGHAAPTTTSRSPTSVRDRLLQRWISTAAAYTRNGARTVAYLSAEFLMGPHLGNNLVNLGIYGQVRAGHRRTGPGLRRAAERGGRAGPRQRRPRTARGLLPRLDGDAGDPVARLRHPLRVRHLRPGDPRRLAGGEAPTTGCASATPGRWCGPSGRSR